MQIFFSQKRLEAHPYVQWRINLRSNNQNDVSCIHSSTIRLYITIAISMLDNYIIREKKQSIVRSVMVVLITSSKASSLSIKKCLKHYLLLSIKKTTRNASISPQPRSDHFSLPVLCYTQLFIRRIDFFYNFVMHNNSNGFP